MSIKQNTNLKRCLIPCSDEKVISGQCTCENRFNEDMFGNYLNNTFSEMKRKKREENINKILENIKITDCNDN